MQYIEVVSFRNAFINLQLLKSRAISDDELVEAAANTGAPECIRFEDNPIDG